MQVCFNILTVWYSFLRDRQNVNCPLGDMPAILLTGDQHFLYVACV
jgi:hypothetical protein